MSNIVSNIPSIRRQLKNVAYNYSDAQVKVREATSNDPWGAPSTLMAEVADMTYNTMAFTEIMQMVWKRLNDNGKHWRHVYKALVLLDYLIKTGSEKVAQQCKENIYAIQTLKDFQFVEDSKDHGLNVREKAKQLVALLKDDERLKNERARALMAKKRFAQNGIGFGAEGTTYNPTRPPGEGYNIDEDDVGALGSAGSFHGRTRRESELDEARPTSPGEEELQLQIALALSREEAAKEEEMRKGDDVRLQMALKESKSELTRQSSDPAASVAGASASRPQHSSTSALDDLLSIGGAFGSAEPAMATDPWGAPIIPPPTQSTSTASRMDPWATSVLPMSPQQNVADPWAPVNSNPPPNFPPPVYDAWAPVQPTQQTAMDTNGWGHSLSNTTELHGTPGHFDLSNGHNGTSHQPDPWNLDGIGGNLPTDNNTPGSEGLTNASGRRQLKTPESFLGENSSLVNLDNLMGPAKPVTTAKAVTNPFMGTSTAGNLLGATSAAATNPFAAQQRPSPTLNQMRVGQTPTSDPTGSAWGGFPGNNQPAAGQPWSVQQQPPLQPQRPGSTNPFM